MDQLQIDYLAGEIRLEIKRLQDLKSEYGEPLKGFQRGRETLKKVDDKIAALKSSLKHAEDLRQKFMRHDEAIAHLKKEFPRMRHLMGYRFLWDTDSKFDAERMKRACRSTKSELRIVTEAETYYSYTIQFDISELDEVGPIEDDE